MILTNGTIASLKIYSCPYQRIIRIKMTFCIFSNKLTMYLVTSLKIEQKKFQRWIKKVEKQKLGGPRGCERLRI